MSEVKRYAVWASPVSDGPTWVEFTQDLRNNFPDAKGYVREEDFDRVTAERDALQALLTAADEKNDTLSTAYLSAGVREHLLRLRVADLEGLLQMFIENTDDKDVIELAQHALKPAEGGGDE